MENTRKDLKKMSSPLIVFAGKKTYPLRVINLLLAYGEWWKMLKTDVVFIVVDAPNSYNTILNRTTQKLNMILGSKCHQKMN